MATEPTIAVLNGTCTAPESRESTISSTVAPREVILASNKRRKLTLDLFCLQQAAQSLLEHKRLRWRRK